jgi:Zn-dependent M32 family carboxypeptidase
MSWWAMRGQLIDAPGYMMNYALGAVIVTAIRERIAAVHGQFATGDPSWYPWLSAHLLQFGLARSARDVLSELLGGPLTDDALLRDLARIRPASSTR